jgi:hypothetical protein
MAFRFAEADINVTEELKTLSELEKLFALEQNSIPKWTLGNAEI